MVNYDQAWIVGGIFLLVAALLIASLMRESIPYKIRRGAQLLAFLGVVGFAVFAAVQKSSGRRAISWSWPSLETAPSTPPDPANALPTPPAVKASAKPSSTEWHAAPNLNRRLKVGTMREVTAEEARRLLAR
jgi:hypothetical protein